MSADDYGSSSALSWKWVLISMGIFFVSQIIVSVVFGLFTALTLGLGVVLFLIIKPVVYFVGGYITGRLSPGITIREPAIGAVIISVLGGLFDSGRFHGLGVIWIIIGSVIAYFCALAGAKMGEGVE